MELFRFEGTGTVTATEARVVRRVDARDEAAGGGPPDVAAGFPASGSSAAGSSATADSSSWMGSGLVSAFFLRFLGWNRSVAAFSTSSSHSY